MDINISTTAILDDEAYWLLYYFRPSTKAKIKFKRKVNGGLVLARKSLIVKSKKHPSFHQEVTTGVLIVVEQMDI